MYETYFSLSQKSHVRDMYEKNIEAYTKENTI